MWASGLCINTQSFVLTPRKYYIDCIYLTNLNSVVQIDVTHTAANEWKWMVEYGSFSHDQMIGYENNPIVNHNKWS